MNEPVSRELWIQQRMEDLANAIAEHAKAQKLIPPVWAEEYNDLLGQTLPAEVAIKPEYDQILNVVNTRYTPAEVEEWFKIYFKNFPGQG